MKRMITILEMVVLLTSCVADKEFSAPKQDCINQLEANISFEEVKALYSDSTIKIQEDWVIQGYVVSSDSEGNFFSILHFQNEPVNPTEGLQIEIDQRETHLFFPVGSKIFIKLKGLYLGQSKGVYKLGGTFSSFGNLSVGRLPALKIQEHIFLACDQTTVASETLTTIPLLEEMKTSTLVRLENLEIIDDELGETFAIEAEETQRTLQDCEENQVILLNSGFSSFQSEILPEGNGDVTGVLLKEGGDVMIAIRDLKDLQLIDERCPEIITEFTSTKIFISELADPDNNAGARFVEIYNADDSALDLNKWTLRRYTNANTEISSSIDLSGNIIEAKATLIISPNAGEFELVYGFPPDVAVSTNSPADSNGDDNLELVDPFGNIIDVFGVIGEDGSGTNHEFEDGRAVRRSEVVHGNPTYTFSEWEIFNDTGDAGTTQLPQNAPQDFTPGVRD
nr:DUF5689 domain-containing protein [Allomuricauda sp.]